MASVTTVSQTGKGKHALFWDVCANADSRHGLRSRLEVAIDSGQLVVGLQLPTERDIADRCNLSRSTVRSVLQELERSGRINREVGRGTFVASNDATARQPRVLMSPGDLVEMRIVIEPSIVSIVVYNATVDDLARMENALIEGRNVKEWTEAERCDAAFHDLFYRATHNEGIRQIANIILDARRSETWLRLKQSTFDRERWAIYQEEHTRIFERIAARDAAGAKKMILQHLVGVQTRMV